MRLSITLFPLQAIILRHQFLWIRIMIFSRIHQNMHMRSWTQSAENTVWWWTMVRRDELRVRLHSLKIIIIHRGDLFLVIFEANKKPRNSLITFNCSWWRRDRTSLVIIRRNPQGLVLVFNFYKTLGCLYSLIET